jgi:hypothetical protein
VTVPLGRLVQGRSGDKGGTANVGLWADDERTWAWLRDHLDEAMVRQLVPEAADLRIEVHHLPNLWGVNVLIHGILGEGATSSPASTPRPRASQSTSGHAT